MFQVLATGTDKRFWEVKKEYKYRSQAVAWCWLHGYVVSVGRYGCQLNGNAVIVEKDD